MWFKQLLPEGPDTVRVVAAFCFTQEAVARPDFEEVVQSYHKRFELVIGEDNDISGKHLAGVGNPLARAGRFSSLEPLVHRIDNWIVDRVIGRSEDEPKQVK